MLTDHEFDDAADSLMVDPSPNTHFPCTFLFQGLRTNRTLLSLDLGSNQIRDAGAAKLAQVRTYFTKN